MADQEEKVEEQETAAEEAAEEAPAEAEASDAEEAAPEAVEAEPEAAAEETGEAETPSELEAEASAESADAEAAEPEAETETAPEPETAPEAPAEEAPAEEAPAEEAPAAPEEELTFEVLHKRTVAELRDIAQGIEHDALHGYSTMHKEHLVPALCTALGIEAHVHHEVVGINKDRVKEKIKALKVERQQALEAGDHAQLKLVRKRIKSLKRKIRRATV